MGRDDVHVYTASGEPEAQQIKAFFRAHGIPCTFRGESVRLTHAFTLDGLGAVAIFVPPELAERACDLLERVASGELALREWPRPVEPDDDSGPV